MQVQAKCVMQIHNTFPIVVDPHFWDCGQTWLSGDEVSSRLKGDITNTSSTTHMYSLSSQA